MFYSGRGSSFFDFTGFCEGVSRDTDPNLLLHFLKNVWRNIKANGPMIALGRYMYTARLRTFGEVEEFIQWVQG